MKQIKDTTTTISFLWKTETNSGILYKAEEDSRNAEDTARNKIEDANSYRADKILNEYLFGKDQK